MAAVTSTMVELGTRAPMFSLPDVTTGETVTLADLRRSARGMLVMFLCNHCPFVKHVRDELAKIGREYQPKGIAVVAISSNDVASYPDDGPEKMVVEAREAGYTFPYLYDETQGVANAFRAACTPDFFVFDSGNRLIYRGQLDESRPKNGLPLTGRDVRRALEGVLSGRPPLENQMPSIGCNIKWKTGNEPDYV